MKITLCREDMVQVASQVKQIRKINSLEFDDKTVICKVSLDNKAIGIFGVPENWIITLVFAHAAGAVSATLTIASDAEPVGGNSKISAAINNTAQTLLNGITAIAGLEKRILSAIKLPNFASSHGKSITVDLDKLLQDKLNGNVYINAIDCEPDSISLDVSFKF
jgi:glutamine cyclotransferase